MEPHAPLFPSVVTSLSDLYGASSYRVAEAHAYAQEMDDLDREERAFEQTMQALVHRKAPDGIGVQRHKSHSTAVASTTSRTQTTSLVSTRLQRGGVAPVGTEGSRLGSGVQTTRGYHGHVTEDDDEEDMEEEDDELHELDDDDEEEEEEGDDHEELFLEEEAHDDETGEDDEMDVSM